MAELTIMEHAIYDFVKRYREEMSVSPSMREIGDAVGLYSVSSVHRYVRSIADKGWFVLHTGKARSIIPKADAL